MSKTLKLGMLALLLAVPAAYAQDVTYDWTLTGTVSGSGTITLNPAGQADDPFQGGMGMYGMPFNDPYYVYQPDGITGTLGYTSPTEYTLTSLQGFNLATTSSTLPSSTFSPLAYLQGGSTGGTWNIDIQPGFGAAQVSGNPFVDSGETFTLSPQVSATPVPESPLSPGLVAAGGLLIGWRSWRKMRTAQA